MRVRVVLRRQAIFCGQTVEVGHRGIANYAGIAVVLLENDKNMIATRNGTRKNSSVEGYKNGKNYKQALHYELLDTEGDLHNADRSGSPGRLGMRCLQRCY